MNEKQSLSVQVARYLDNEFVSELKNGVLSGLLDAIKKDKSLIFEIRHNKFHVYYRGGRLLEVEKQNKQGVYHFKWDAKYAKYKNDYLQIKQEIKSIEKVKTESDLQVWIGKLDFLKGIMNEWFGKHPKPEKFIQQELVLTQGLDGYIFTDFEYQKGQDARFDLVAVNMNLEPPVLSFIELKQGYNSLVTKVKKVIEDEKGVKEKFTSGLKKHLVDIKNEFSSKESIKAEVNQALVLLELKKELGFLSDDFKIPEISELKYEVLFVLADYKSENGTRFSTQLEKELTAIKDWLKTESEGFFQVKLMMLKTQFKLEVVRKSSIAVVDQDYNKLLKEVYPEMYVDKFQNSLV